MKRIVHFLSVLLVCSGLSATLWLSPSFVAAQEGGGDEVVVVDEAPPSPQTAPADEIDAVSFGIQLTFMGMGVVFVALLILAGALTFAQRWQLPEENETAPVPATTSIVSAPTISGGVAPEVMAAISAAVAVVGGERYRIKRIRYHEVQPLDAWSRQGRVTIMTSRRGRR